MSGTVPKSIRLVEVGPRDGLQNESQVLSTEDKIEFIRLLSLAGPQVIEATSFVRPDKIPQMGDATKLYQGLVSKGIDQKVSLPCLVPNLKGLEAAKKVGVKEIAVFTATSETFNKKNINSSIDDSLVLIEAVAKQATREGIRVRGYVSTVFGCPYEGETSVDKLIQVIERLEALGAYDISLGDTIGVATPTQTRTVIEELRSCFDLKLFSMHFHDTHKRALDNTKVSLEEGITSFDSSAGGLGGCPYADGATGNMATEDLVNLCESLGIETGVDRKKLTQASQFILEKLSKPLPERFKTNLK